MVGATRLLLAIVLIIQGGMLIWLASVGRAGAYGWVLGGILVPCGIWLLFKRTPGER